MFPLRTPLLAAGAAAVLVAACQDNVGVGACFEDGLPYGYALGGDTSLVFRWPGDRQPVRVYAEPVGTLPANVQDAVARWAGTLRCGELTALMTADSGSADIIVRNPATLPGAGPGSILLAADSVGACDGVTIGDFDETLTLLGPVRSYVSPVSADSVALAGCYRMVTTHELGHAFGILAHSLDTADVMYATPRRTTPSPSDRVTFQYLYHTTPTILPQP